jgi:hypothetical protein
MSKVIKSINLLSIYDNEDFHLVDFEYNNTSRNDFKNRYISMTLNFNTRKQIHNWLRNDKNNKVIIADAKFCNEGYYNYAIRMLNVYNKQEVIQTILLNTDSETCEERLKLRGTSFKYFYNSLLEFSNIYNVNNSCYINPNIYYDINSILYVI